MRSAFHQAWPRLFFLFCLNPVALVDKGGLQGKIVKIVDLKRPLAL